jgi:hypothetical protein
VDGVVALAERIGVARGGRVVAPGGGQRRLVLQARELADRIVAEGEIVERVTDRELRLHIGEPPVERIDRLARRRILDVWATFMSTIR